MIVLAIIPLLSLATFVNTESCPPSEDIAPCLCEEDEEYDSILVNCDEEIKDISDLIKSLKSLSGKKNVEIEFDYIDLGEMPSDIFAGIEVTKLEISHCELDSLSDSDSQPALQGLEDSLEELSIVSSFSEDNLPVKLKLGHLRKLKELDVSFNSISEIDNEWFENGPSSLEYLFLSNNRIEKIGDRAFATLQNLKQISLDGNRFGAIKRTMLPSSADDLDTLELDNNALTSIPEDIFSNMPVLDHVSLRNNGIVRLERKTWESVWHQLSVIHLEGNPLECDSHMSWTFNLPITTAIYGTCEAPREHKGKDLQVFIDDKGQ